MLCRFAAPTSTSTVTWSDRYTVVAIAFVPRRSLKETAGVAACLEEQTQTLTGLDRPSR